MLMLRYLQRSACTRAARSSDVTYGSNARGRSRATFASVRQGCPSTFEVLQLPAALQPAAARVSMATRSVGQVVRSGCMYESNFRALVFVAYGVSLWCVCSMIACGSDSEPSG